MVVKTFKKFNIFFSETINNLLNEKIKLINKPNTLSP